MLKHYSFFGVTLELIAVMGVFFAVLVVIFIAAIIEALRTAKRSAARKSGEGRPT
ncbi:hypothetical protein ACFQI7_20930 [Paenibacillus allorhizosphaerae]|uniref:Holin-like toxin n=1 Tax=Paenibacillus allorhizosphaerae TaxID=2849866 RepID=A0ABM8VRL9_9BACL|nr:hypothetical protein [Paenibacillus allorhizosphaerae]CAG7655375.1 hypothetical protein PAECIP111802_06095 [Paenibacillus allorhizosphaerae]